MKTSNTTFITQAAMIAALYVALCMVFAPISYGEVQLRVAEALTILPVFTPAAIPGLAIGCFIANLTGGGILPDMIFGTAATLIGAVGTRLLKKKPALAWIPPVISNMIIVPLVLIHVYQVPDVSVTLPFTQTTLSGSGFLPLMLTVGIGEIISCGILGLLVYKAAKRTLPASAQD